MGWSIENGQVLRDGALHAQTLGVDGARIGAPGGRRLDATGLLVLPGIVDIHGDAHERCLQPRPRVEFPAPFALADAAAQMLACGITTAALGVTLSWEPGLRSLATFRAILAALESPPPGPDLRLHLRWEADNLDAEPDALAAIAAGRIAVLCFNDHTPPPPGAMRFREAAPAWPPPAAPPACRCSRMTTPRRRTAPPSAPWVPPPASSRWPKRSRRMPAPMARRW